MRGLDWIAYGLGPESWSAVECSCHVVEVPQHWVRGRQRGNRNWQQLQLENIRATVWIAFSWTDNGQFSVFTFGLLGVVQSPELG